MDIKAIQRDDGSFAIAVKGKSLACPVCGNDTYHERGSLLNTRSSELFNVAWADSKATNFICTNCGYIYWFLV